MSEPPKEETDRYLIWSNEHRAWWAPGSRGYVRGAWAAGRFTRDEALQFCTQAALGSLSGFFNELPVRERDLAMLVEDAGGLVPRDLL